MDERKALEALQREIRDRRRLGRPTGTLPEQEAELRRQLHLPAPPRKQKPPPAPRKQPTLEQEADMQRWHREHKRR